MLKQKLFTPIYIADTPFINGQLKPKKAKKYDFKIHNSEHLNNSVYHFVYSKGDKLIDCFYVVEDWQEPDRLLFIENNELYDEFTKQFGREGEGEIGGMDVYLDTNSLKDVPIRLTEAIKAGTYYEETPLCHLYGQGMWHDNAYVVANRIGLEKLREAIDIALNNGEFRMSSSTSDNEGYDLFISCVPDNFDWDSIEMPYNDTDIFEKTKPPVLAFNNYRLKLK
jgi:hypothetical protein